MTTSTITTGEDADGKAYLHRLEFLSDGVFAIAITLLAIELHAPEEWSGRDVGGLLEGLRPQLLAYGLGFAIIAIYWISHRRMFSRLVKADLVVALLNFVMLAFIGLMPLATGILYEKPGDGAIIVYFSLVALIGVAQGLTWGYAAFIRNIVRPDVRRSTRLFVLCTMTLMPAVMCGLSLWSGFTHTLWGWMIMTVLGVVVGRVGARLGKPRPASAA